MDPSKYTELRKRFIQTLREQNTNPYPHKFQREMSIKDLREKYDNDKIANSDFLTETVNIVGRIMQIRASGAKLIFIDLLEGDSKVQIFATAEAYKGDFEFLHKTLRRGDIIGV